METVGYGPEEQALVENLKSICDNDGKERHPERAAGILHQLALIYKSKSPDKLSLIRSAVLLNASILRKPSDLAHQDLVELCSHLLKLAKAKRLKTDLIEISQNVEKQVYDMRGRVNEFLKSMAIIPSDAAGEDLERLEMKKVGDVRSLQEHITSSYTDIMHYVSAKCVEIMGDPPCKFAIAGMGSLARQEISPYSDFEHVILLDEAVKTKCKFQYNRANHYFRWFTVIFQIILINLRETIIPSVAIPSLNNFLDKNNNWFYDAYTGCGISFDGLMPHACKFPLGRQQKTKKKPWKTELIKAVSSMVRYLNTKEELKNGYHLGDILTKTCYVYGDRNVFDDFATKVKTTLQENRRSSYKQLMEQLEEDLRNFDAGNFVCNLSHIKTCNIKRVIYRSTTLFISALGRMHMINEPSCFDIIKCLQERNIISDENAHNLSYAVSVACEARLRVYMSRKRQDDSIKGEGDIFYCDDNLLIPELTKIMGIRSLVDYFVIAYNLQTFIKVDGLSAELHQGLRVRRSFEVMHLLGFNELLLKEWEQHTKEAELDVEKVFYAAKVITLENCSKALPIFQMLDDMVLRNWPYIRAYVKVDIARSLYRLGRYQESLAYTEKAKEEMLYMHIPHEQIYVELSWLCHIEGTCHYQMHNHEEAYRSFTKQLDYMDKPNVPENLTKRIDCIVYTSLSSMKLGFIDHAINYAIQASELCDQTTVPISMMCECYWVLGCCYAQKNEHKTALVFFEKELKIRLHFVPEERQKDDVDIKWVKLHIENSKQKLKLVADS